MPDPISRRSYHAAPELICTSAGRSRSAAQDQSRTQAPVSSRRSRSCRAGRRRSGPGCGRPRRRPSPGRSGRRCSFSASAQTVSRSSPCARELAAGLGEQPAAEAAALALGPQVELVDLAARRGPPAPAAAEGGVAGQHVVAVEHQRAEAALVHPAPPGRAAAGDHPLERQAGDDAGIGIAPGLAVHARRGRGRRPAVDQRVAIRPPCSVSRSAHAPRIRRIRAGLPHLSVRGGGRREPMCDICGTARQRHPERSRDEHQRHPAAHRGQAEDRAAEGLQGHPAERRLHAARVRRDRAARGLPDDHRPGARA